MLTVLRLTGWWFCVAYATVPLFWLAIHPFAHCWRSHKSPYRILGPWWAATWVLVAAVTYRWRGVLLYQNPWSWIPGLTLIFLGFWLYFASTRGFNRKYVSGMAEVMAAEGESGLIVCGIRRHMRHPMYAGHLCEILGWTIGSGLAVCFLLAAFAVSVGAIMIHMEDKELESRFGEQYRAYRRSVPAFLPKF